MKMKLLSTMVLICALAPEARVDADDDVGGFPESLYHSKQEPFRSFPCLPRRLHIAQASNVLDGGLVNMTVTFSLEYEKCKFTIPSVIYGHDLVAIGSVRGSHPLQFNYTSDKSHGIFQSDWIYHVQLPNLQAGPRHHWYRIVVEEERSQPVAWHRSLRGSGGYYLGETKTYPFLTPPLPHSPTTLALVGDVGQTQNSLRTMVNIYQATRNTTSKYPPVTQLLIAGDMSYADSDPYRWISWMELMEPLVRTTSVHVAAGNHEIECDAVNYDIFVQYEHYFRNPNRIGPAKTEPVDNDYRQTLWNQSCSAPSNFQGIYNFGNSFYSYHHGLVHIVVLNSYSDCRRGSVQYEWLESELRDRFNRSHTPWLLVAFHSPLYTTFFGHIDEIEAVRMREHMEPLFVEYGVNLVVCGHDHAYMRTFPMANSRIDPRGPVHLTLGAGGNREGHPFSYRNPFFKEFWVAKRSMQDYGYGHLVVANATHAEFQWVRDRITDNDFDDRVWFVNSHV